MSVPVGVIGVGVFGEYHLKKYLETDRAQVMGVYDADFDKAQTVAERYDLWAVQDLSELLERVEAVTIAAPASVHHDLGMTVLKAGRHALIEKPLALSLPEADDLISAARHRKLVLQVGHQERYVLSAFGLLSDQAAPLKITARRCGPYTPRGSDVSVVLDLMVHDLDLIRQFVRSDLISVQADASTAYSEHADEVTAHLVFANGAQVELIASRMQERRVRDMRLEYQDGRVIIDFVARKLTSTRRRAETPDFESIMDTPEGRDPLGFGVDAFLQNVQAGTNPRISGEDGRAALDYALQIEQAAREDLRVGVA